MRGTIRNAGHSRFASTLLFAGLLVLLCGGVALAQTSTLSVTSSGAQGAVITGTYPGTTDYQALGVVNGTNVTLTAAPSVVSGGQTYGFVQWTSAAGWTISGMTISGTVNADTTLVAQYVLGWTLYVNSTPIQGIPITVGNYPGTTNYMQPGLADGTLVNLTAPATFVSGGATYNFLSWSAPAGWTVAGTTVSGAMHSGVTLLAQYSAPQYAITVSWGANGVVTPKGAANPGTVWVTGGASQTFTFTPDATYAVKTVTVDGSPVTPALTYTFNAVAAAHTIDVQFATALTITASAGTGGVISPTGTVAVASGNDQTFTFTPNAGYAILSVSVDGLPIGAPASYTYTNVTVNGHTISVTFKAVWTIFASAGANGTISPSGAVVVDVGTNATFTFTPNAGYVVDALYVDSVLVPSPGASYTFLAVGANHTIAVTFKLAWIITASSSSNGSISPAGKVAATDGSDQSFFFTPGSGFKVLAVYVDGAPIGGTPLSYTFTAVHANHTISVAFGNDTTTAQWTITAVAGSNGTITPTGSVKVDDGSSQQFIFTPAAGHSVTAVIVDGSPQPLGATYTFNNVHSNHTITVAFGGWVITASAGPNGSINPSGAVSVNDGNSQTFGFTPALGSQITAVYVDNVLVGTPTSYTFTAVHSDHTISVSFGTWVISATSEGNGTISPAGSISVADGGTQAFTITPAVNYQVLDVVVDGVSRGRPATYTFAAVHSNHTIDVSFELLYTLTINMAGPADPVGDTMTGTANRYSCAGTTSPAAGVYVQKYKYGQTVPISIASVNKDYKFGEYRSGATDPNSPTNNAMMTLQDQPYADPADDTTSDLYWLVNGSTATLGPVGVIAPPQNVTVTMQGDTVVTAWYVRADIIHIINNAGGEQNIFEPLDTQKKIGITYNGYFLSPNGVAVQLQFEDTFPVQPLGSLSPGPGGQVCVDMARETGTPGAILFHPVGSNDTPANIIIDLNLFPTPGAVQFGKLQIDRVGHDYQLAFKYFMYRASHLGVVTRMMPGDGMILDNSGVPIVLSSAFDITPSATSHFTMGYNYYGQLGIGLVTPVNLAEVTPAHDSDVPPTGLPQPATWTRTNPPEDAGFGSALQPQNPATHAASFTSNHASIGPVGMPGYYTATYPHWSSQIGFAHDYSGWFSPLLLASSEIQWAGRTMIYPDDWYADGRDHFEPVQPYHTSLCHGWESYQRAFNAVSAGQMFSAALRDDGSLWMFGDNTYGQCGVGTLATATYTTPYTSQTGFQAFADPVSLADIGSLGDVINVASGFQHVVALKGDGTVWVWGRNNKGQLGLGAVDDQAGGHPAPAQVPGLTNVAAVFSGDYYSLALKHDGSVWGWGLNSDGQLGDGTRNDHASPIQVGIAVRQGDGTINWGLGTTLFTGHTDRVLGVAASPDSQYVLTCSADGTARLCDAVTGRLIRTIASSGPNAHTGPINAVAFSPDGAKIVTGSSDRTAKIWALDGTYLATFADTQSTSHDGSVTSVAFSPDGHYVITGSVDTTAKVWNATTYAKVATCSSSLMGVNAVAFSGNFPAYNRVYVASGDQTIKMYEATTGVFKRNFNGPVGVAHANSITSLAVVKAVISGITSDFIVSGSIDSNAKVWQVVSGSDSETLVTTLASMFDSNISGHYDAVNCVAITTDSVTNKLYVLTGSRDMSVKRWTNASGSWVMDESYARHTDSVNAVAFGYKPNQTVPPGVQDENLIVSSSSDRTAIIAKTPVVTALAAGTSHTLALREDGTVLAWGYNGSGQLGQNDYPPSPANQNKLNPAQVLDPAHLTGATGFLQGAAGVSAGNAHSAVVTTGGNVLSWGSNTYGELAQGPGTVGVPVCSATPLKALNATSTPISGITAVSAGWGYSMARGSGVYAWGNNAHGRMGIDGPGQTSDSMSGNFPSATPWTSPVAPWGATWGNSPMTTLSARYWHTQFVQGFGIHTVTWHVDPPVGGIVVPDTSLGTTTSQSGQPGQTVYTFQTINPTDGTAGKAQAESGTIVRLLAIPRPGYTFDHWGGYAPSQTVHTSWQFWNYVEEDPQATPMVATAYFTATPRKFQLAIATNPVGATAVGAGTYSDGEVATLTATSDANFTFDHWSGDPDIENLKSPTAYLRMSGNKTITANFVAVIPSQYTLTVHCSPPAGGSISDITSTPSALLNNTPYTYQAGATVTMGVTANAGYVFSNWVETDATDTDQLTSTSAPNTSLTMTSIVAAKDVTAYFTASSQKYTLTTQTLLNGEVNKSVVPGTITPISGGSYAVNSIVPVQATANAGYSFVGWSLNVTPDVNTPSKGAVSMGQDQTIQANFIQGTLNLSVQSLPFSGVAITSPTNQGTTPYGASVGVGIPVALTAPAVATTNGVTFYYFAGWTLNGTPDVPGKTTLNFPMAASDTAIANYELDATPPSVSGMYPAAGSAQNPLDTIIRLHVTDFESGVDLKTLKILVEGYMIYDGSHEASSTSTSGEYDTNSTTQAVKGYASRSNTTVNDYLISFQPMTSFHYGQTVHVTISASDVFGNPMTPYIYAFTTLSRLFGQNVQANTDGDATNGDLTDDPSTNDTTTLGHPPASVRDLNGNLWVTWAANGSDIWLGELPVSKTSTATPGFAASVYLEAGYYYRAAPTIAVGPTGRMFIVWQDKRNGHWDLFGLSTADGVIGNEFPAPKGTAAGTGFVSTGFGQTTPSVAVDRTGKIYVAWEDATSGVKNIFIAYSTTNGQAWSTPVAVNAQATAQVHPSLAVDAQNNVYVFWADSRTAGQTDIYGASSADGITWTAKLVVSNATKSNHTSPVAAAEPTGNILHLAWVGNDNGGKDIYYASTGGGLPASPIAGTDIIDTSEQGQHDHVAPSIAVTGSGSNADAFIAWQDSRYVTKVYLQNTDIMFCDVFAGAADPANPPTNVIVDDEINMTAQRNPCVGVDQGHQAYVFWEDNRIGGRWDIWFAGTCSPDPNNTSSLVGTAGTANSIQTPFGTIVINLMPVNAQVTVSKVLNPPIRPQTPVGDCFMIQPSGIQFTDPAKFTTITVPYDVATTPVYANYLAFYFDYNSGVWLNDGITAVTADTVAGTVQFQTTHTSMFSVAGVGTPVAAPTGTTTGPVPPSGPSSPGGGCFIATAAYEAELPGLDGALEVNCTGRYVITAERMQKLNDIRGLRDEVLLRIPQGRAFSAWYYALAPYAANAIRDNDPAKAAVRTMLLNPLSELSRMCGAEPQLKK